MRFAAFLFIALTACRAEAQGGWPEDMDRRLAACSACHGERGHSATGEYFPSIAGKPAGYLFQQILNFRDGRRHHEVMERMFAYLSDDYLSAMAAYYAAQPPAIATPVSGAAPEVLARGRELVERGDPASDVPACAACHGESLAGAQPAIPGLVGLPLDYLAAQLGAWREGTRKAREPDCMGEIARRLSAPDLLAAATWIASRPTGAAHRPLARAPAELPMECGGVP